MADSSVANAAKESAQAEFSHGLQNKRTDGDKMRTRLLNEAAACVGISEAFADAGRLPATTLGSDIL
jgi:hypothetical protein